MKKIQVNKLNQEAYEKMMETGVNSKITNEEYVKQEFENNMSTLRKDSAEEFSIEISSRITNYRSSSAYEINALLNNKNCLAVSSISNFLGNMAIRYDKNSYANEKASGITSAKATILANNKANLDVLTASINNRISLIPLILRERGLYVGTSKHIQNQIYSTTLLVENKLLNAVLFDIDNTTTIQEVPKTLEESLIVKADYWIVSTTKDNERFAVAYLNYLNSNLKKDKLHCLLVVHDDSSKQATLKVIDGVNKLNATHTNLKKIPNLKEITEDNFEDATRIKKDYYTIAKNQSKFKKKDKGNK